MSAMPSTALPPMSLYRALLARLVAAGPGGAAEGPSWPSPPSFPPPESGRFGGLTPDAFAFFSALAAENTREWFQAHANVYRQAVDRPWRALLGILTEPLRDWLPDLDTDLRVGHVCSRINRQWPRAGAVYHTGLRAVFAPRGAPRPAAAALGVAIDATGVWAGAEVRAGTPAWSAACQAAADPAWVRLAAGPGVAWALAGRPVAPPDVAACARRAGRRAVLRLGSAWDATTAAALGKRLPEAVRDALWRSLPLYVAAMGAARAAEAQGPDGAGEQAGAVAPAAAPGHGVEPVPSPPAAPPKVRARWTRRRLGSPERKAEAPGGRPLPRLPAALHGTLRDIAAAEGVSLEAIVVFALTRFAAGGRA